ncbi:hypothetical protein EG829_02350 [bacterium]|nr:hypothetical protein [bacterium]
MNTSEMVSRIDALIGMGEKIKAENASDGSDGMKGFRQGIKTLIEDVHGSGNQLSAGFCASDVYDPRMVAEGIAVLEDLRRVVLYTGEFSS